MPADTSVMKGTLSQTECLPTLLPAGARVADFTIVSSSTDRLILRGSRKFAAWAICVGLALTIVGGMGVAAFLLGGRVSPKLLFVPIGGICSIVGGILHLNTICGFDRATRSFARRSAFGAALRGKFSLIGGRGVVCLWSYRREEP